MANIFRLAGLLRLRQLREDVARADLARTRAAEQARKREEARVRAVLGDSGVDASSVETVQSIAAARASSSSMLSELDALLAGDAAAVEAASAVHREARTATVQLEKLEQRHDARARADRLRAEQRALDEHAGRSASRAADEEER